MSRFGKVAHNVVNIINLFQLHKPHKPFSPDVGVCVIYSLEAASQQILHCDSARQLQIHFLYYMVSIVLYFISLLIIPSFIKTQTLIIVVHKKVSSELSCFSIWMSKFY